MKPARNNPAHRHRRHASRCVILCSLFAALATTGTASAAASAPRRDLLAHGGERLSDKISPVWVAMLEQPAKEGQSEKTVVLAREEIGDKKWQQMPETPARVIGLTSHGNELVVMIEGKDKSLEKRTWAWFSVDRQSNMSRFSYGPPLPQSVRLIALGGDRRSLYALGVARPDIGVAQRTAVPDSQRSGAATAPVTQALQPSVPTLFLLAGDKWTPMAADWPKEAAGAAELASLHVIGDVPHVAVPTGQNAIRIYKFVRDPGDWVQTHEVKVEGELRLVKLLNNEDRPALWAQTTDELGSLWSPKYAVQKVQFSGVKPKPEEMDVTVSGDIRLFFRRDGKPYEQHFNWDGTPSGAAQLLDWTRPRTDPSLNLLTTVFMTVLAVLLVSTLLRRRNMNREDERGEPEE
jgi:hypothetical protein